MVKVVETGYPTRLLVEKGNNGKTQYKLDKEQIYYWLKKRIESGGWWTSQQSMSRSRFAAIT